ncbi:MAG: hypothetical protein V8T65_12065 [Roseburia inulinivorans]
MRATAAEIIDTFDPILSNIAVSYNGTALAAGTDYTYNEATGLFATTAGRITVPAAAYTPRRLDRNTGNRNLNCDRNNLITTNIKRENGLPHFVVADFLFFAL